MFGAIESAHTAVGLIPDAKIFKFGITGISSHKHFLYVAPVHAGVVNRPVQTMGGQMLESIRQERGETRCRHFTTAHGKGAVVDLTFAPDVTVDSDIVRWVGENQAGFDTVEYSVVRIGLQRIATKNAVGA